MKILHLSYSDLAGGAAKAALRLHVACQDNGLDSTMLVSDKRSNIKGIISSQNHLEKNIRHLLNYLESRISLLALRDTTSKSSIGLIPSKTVEILTILEADVINLHWINNGFLSIEDIGKLNQPLVWTLHDMWPFCGSEHYVNDSNSSRWREGYTYSNRPPQNVFDLNQWAWNRKRKAWKKPIQIVAPTPWLADCVQQSALLKDWPVEVIPNPIDIKTFQPRPRKLARKTLGLPQDKHLVLFGAAGGVDDPRKGWDLIQQALMKLSVKKPNIAGVIFGQSEPSSPPRLGLPLYWMGQLNDEVTLSLLYSAVDVMTVPSRLDNLPQTGTEAQACGCPVVAFDVGGLKYVIEDKKTGYLAKPFDINDLTSGLLSILDNDSLRNFYAEQARKRAVNIWNPEKVIKQYANIYEKARNEMKLSTGHLY